MSDLISRSELIKALDKYCGNQRYLVSENIREIINNQPTAYSVDDVVEELESELEKGNIAIDLGEFRLFEIVKLGGVSDDVCEWKMTDTKKLMPYETSCGNEDLYDNSYKYCPYCSKKIKVVG